MRLTEIPYDASAMREGSTWNPHLTIAVIGSIAIIVIAITANVPTYRVAPVFLVPILWAPFVLRRWLALSALSYGAYLVAILLHDLGAYGFYQKSPLGFSWDIVVHFYFAVPGALILHGALSHHFPDLRPWQINVTTLLFIMGFGAIHEIIEYASYLLLGEETGMLKPKTSYFFDTQRDLLNNLLGCVTTLAARAIFEKFSAKRVPSGMTESGEPVPSK